MADYSQDTRVASVTASSVSDTLLLYRMSGTESLGRLFEYELELLSESGSVNLQSLLGNPITVKLQLATGGPRNFNGLVTKVSQLGMMGRLYQYRATMHPKPWLLTRASNCQVLQQLSVPDIVKKILGAHGFSDIKNQLSASYDPREYCVQYRESDFNFISRLMEEEGIYYFFEHTDSTHTMVLCDDMTAHQNMPGNANISYFASAAAGVEYFFDWCLNQEIRSGSFTLNDFDFTAPAANLVNSYPLQASHPQADKEIYDYPGEYSEATDGSKNAADGDKYAQIRMEEHRAEFERINAQGNIRGLATGSKFTLQDFPRADQNREYLVVSSRLQIQNNGFLSFGIPDSDNEEYKCSYEVMSTTYTYRSRRQTPIPFVQGVQTAIVVGNSGDEITTDKYGRVKVQFHWDRLGQKDQNSSCWIRVAQIWAGKSWGAIFIPRIGQEVIVDFLEGNPDCPIIIGSVYNAVQTVPYTLPDNKTQSGIMTRSSLSGKADNYNQIRFEDKKSSEELLIHAEKDYKLEVENNDTQTIGSDKSDDGSQTVSIYKNRTVTVDQGDDKLTLNTGNRDVSIKQGNDTLDVTQGDRKVTIGQGNHVLTVSTGDRTVNVKTGNDTLTVTSGDRAVNVKSGNDTLTVTSGNLSVKVNAGQITEEAMQSIELKVGSNSIKIDQTGVTIKGTMISIKGDAQAELKAAMTTVSGDGMLTVKGGIVMIN